MHEDRDSSLPRHLGALTALDWIAIVVTGLLALGLLSFPVVGAQYRAMYADFGSQPLPLLTRLAVSLWFPPLLGALVAAAVAIAVARGVSLGTRRGLVVGAFILGAICLASCWVAVYLPIFQLAGQIRAD